MKKFLSLLISVILVMSSFFCVNISFAQEQKSVSDREIVVNPLYEDYLTVDEAEEMLEDSKQQTNENDGKVYNKSLKSVIFDKLDNAAAYIRDRMVDRERYIEFSFKTKSAYYGDVFEEIFERALSERLAVNSSCGDYLQWSWSAFRSDYITINQTADGYYIYDYDFELLYYTNKQEEQEVQNELENAISVLKINDMSSTFDKISAVYNYICKVCDYDYDVTSPDQNPYSFTSYGCVIQHKTVCQGYATAVYKMCRMLNIPVRIITNKFHAWNIVKIGDWYYDIDATWDDNSDNPYDYSKAKDGVLWGDYIFHNYFLKCDSEFEADTNYHDKDAEYLTAEFKAEYPISERSYYRYVYEDVPITSSSFYHSVYCPVCGEIKSLSEKCTFENDVCIYCSRNIAKPKKVTGLYTAGRGEGGTRIRLSWDKQNGADSYNVYQKIDGKYQLIGSTESNDFNVTGLNAGWQYYFKVTAYREGIESQPSDELHTVSACASVADFTVKATDVNTIQLNWTKGSCHGYYIQWSTDPTFKTGVQYKNVAYSQLDSYTITVNGNAQDYYVRIRAWRNWDGGYVFGEFSEPVKAEMSDIFKVTGLITAGRGEGGTRIRLGWDAQSNADSYNVYQKIDGEFQLIGTTKSNDFNVTGLNAGWEYYFKVAAVKGNEVGALSDELHTVSACASVADFTVKATDADTIQLNWTKGSCHGYYIQWSTDPTFKTGVQYKNVANSRLDSYTINVNGNAQDYYVRIRAWRNWDGGYVFGEFSEPIKVEMSDIFKVTGLITAGRGEGGTRIRLGWAAQANADSYNVYQKIDGEFQLIGTTESNDFNVTGLNAGWEYYFKVAAVKDGVAGELSDELHTVSACAYVADFTVKATDADTIQLNWTKGSCHGYYIQWSTDPTFKTDVHYKNVANSRLDNYTINVDGNAEDYYVRIRAWRNWDGGYVFGEFSEPVKAV